MTGEKLTPSLLLRAYRMGAFPMAHPEDDDAIYWHAPESRGLLPLSDFHVPGTLQKQVRRGIFRVTSDRAFADVIRACADRETTWISDDIRRAYTALHEQGYAHSVECWQDDRLAGGLYGVALGGAFFGESMFYRVSNASKVALVHLVRQLRGVGFQLLDTQYTTPHLEQFGAIEIPRDEYERRLNRALAADPAWPDFEETPLPHQSI